MSYEPAFCTRSGKFLVVAEGPDSKFQREVCACPNPRDRDRVLHALREMERRNADEPIAPDTHDG